MCWVSQWAQTMESKRVEWKVGPWDPLTGVMLVEKKVDS